VHSVAFKQLKLSEMSGWQDQTKKRKTTKGVVTVASDEALYRPGLKGESVLEDL
jgi:hypothetical protein